MMTKNVQQSKNDLEKTSNLDITLKVMKVLYLVLYILFTAFLVYSLVSLFLEPGGTAAEGFGLAFAVVFAVIILSVGPIGYAVLLGIAVIGLIITLINKYSEQRKKNIKFYIIAIILPIVTQGLLIGACVIISTLI